MNSFTLLLTIACSCGKKADDTAQDTAVSEPVDTAEDTAEDTAVSEPEDTAEDTGASQQDTGE